VNSTYHGYATTDYYRVDPRFGTKSVTDGNVRKDFPGGWADDKQNAFTAEGRTKAQNDMFRWTSRLLHWRQGNEVITKGTQTQFCTHKGIYVVARQYKGKSVMTVINGKKEAAELDVKRYAEIIGDAQKAVDVTTGCNVVISHNVKLRPRQTMVLEF
jgi:neopullulanase